MFGRSNLRFLLALLLLLPTSCSKHETKEVQARVSCEGRVTGMLCSVAHVSGDRTAKVCWKVNIACANGDAAYARSCLTVSKKQESTTLIPYIKFINAFDCDPTGMFITETRVVKEE